MTEEAKRQPIEAPQEDFKEFLNQLLSLLPPKARDYVKRYSREILAGALALVLGIILISGYSHYKESQESQAATLMGQALYEKSPEKRISVLEEVIRDHGSTDAARLALNIIARAYYDQGAQEKALEYFKKAAQKAPDHTVVKQSALLGWGYCLEEKGDLGEALKKFDDAIKVSKGLEKIALLDKARVAKGAGKADVALEAYNKVLSEDPSSGELDFVKFEILELKRAEKKKD